MHDINRTMGDTTLEAYENEGDGELGEFQSEYEGPYEGEYEGEAYEGETLYENTSVYAGEEEAYEGEGEAYEAEAYEGEGAYEGEYEGEAYEAEGAYEGEYEAEAYEGEGEGEGEGEYEGEYEGEAYEAEDAQIGEEELDELAGELVSTANEEELEEFLGRVVGSFLRGPVGQQLGGMLRNVAAQTLPVLGQALGNAIGGGAGAPATAAAPAAAGEVYGLETEGLSNEDADFEAAKQFVRMAADAAQTAARTPPGPRPAATAQKALAAAASRHAPGLLAPRGRRGRAGRWFRQGDTLIVLGA